MLSPSLSRITNRMRWSITELSFHGIPPAPPSRGKSVTHVSGTFCYLCLRPLTVGFPLPGHCGDRLLSFESVPVQLSKVAEAQCIANLNNPDAASRYPVLRCVGTFQPSHLERAQTETPHERMSTTIYSSRLFQSPFIDLWTRCQSVSWRIPRLQQLAPRQSKTRSS